MADVPHANRERTTMNATETTIRDLLNTIRDAARRLENGADPDDVAEFLTFSAEQYARVAHDGTGLACDDFGAPCTVAPDYD